MSRVILLILMNLALLPLAPLARADDSQNNSEEHERAEEVYKGTRTGEFLTLVQILGVVADDIPGEVIETKFERIGDVPAYEIYFLDAQGRRQELLVDARTGVVLKDDGDE
jgi:uncharacterized membrane protein YkoI